MKSTVNSLDMRLLGNLSRGINPLQKRLFYRCCALPIALYSFQLWFYNKALISYHMKILNKMQRRAATWILEAFKTSPLEGIEALAGLMPIRFHLQKISKRLLVVATTRHSRTNDLTTSKALSRLSSNKWEITRELDKKPSLHCSSIYITYKWSVLQQCVCLMSVHHASSLRPPYFLHMP